MDRRGAGNQSFCRPEQPFKHSGIFLCERLIPFCINIAGDDQKNGDAAGVVAADFFSVSNVREAHSFKQCPETGRQIMEILHKVGQSGTTILMITHNLQWIEEFPGRVFKCQDRKLLVDAESKEDIDDGSAADEPAPVITENESTL